MRAGKTVAKTHPTLVDEDMGASSKLTNLRECARKKPNQKIMRIAWLGRGSIRFFFTNNLVHKFIPVRQAMKSACESSCGQRLGRARKVASVANDESKEQKRSYSGSEKRARNSTFFCYVDGFLSP